MKICIYGAASDSIDNIYIEKTKNLGVQIAKRGHTIIYGGGNRGLMGAAARGAYSQNGKIVGITPKYFDYDGELFKNCTELIFTPNLSERKRLFDEKSDAFIILPGGIGTFDEFFETLAKRAVNEHKKKIAVFNIAGYYEKLKEFIDFSFEKGFIRKNPYEYFGMFDDEKMIIDYIEK